MFAQIRRGLGRGEFDDGVQFTEGHHEAAQRGALLGGREAVDTHIRGIAPPDVSLRRRTIQERVGRTEAQHAGSRPQQFAPRRAQRAVHLARGLPVREPAGGDSE